MKTNTLVEKQDANVASTYDARWRLDATRLRTVIPQRGDADPRIALKIGLAAGVSSRGP
ncbi:MAG: hypothetical protein JNK67_26460 [Alphaproteobacteria bacterium]|nr:hypothetical protein [Alphaproteobacteria bacterium]